LNRNYALEGFDVGQVPILLCDLRVFAGKKSFPQSRKERKGRKIRVKTPIA